MIKRLVLPLLPMLAAGCWSVPEKEEVTTVQGAHTLHVRSAFSGGDDVAGFQFDVTPVDCKKGEVTGPPVTEVKRLEGLLPGGIDDLENSPLDKASAHLFADAFMVLPAGCYDIAATPVTAKGEPSKVCYAAQKRNVRVRAGDTREVILISQCRGTDPGAVDIVGVLNHPPRIVDVEFERSKFVMCGMSQVVCATVHDPDHDPVELVWTLSEWSPATKGPSVVSREEDPKTGNVTECVEFLPLEPGRFDVDLHVYDLMWNKTRQLRIEDGTEEHHASHAELDFFFYVSPAAMAMAPGGGGSPGPAPAPPTLSEVLILETTVVGGVHSLEATEVVALGLTPRVVDEATWAAMSQSDFAQYRAIVLGDPNSPNMSPAAVANAAVWGAAVNGNVMIVGTDPLNHASQGGRKLTQAGLALAVADATKTGAYITLSEYFEGASAMTPVPLLAGFGTFTAVGANCHNDAHIVAGDPSIASLSDADLSNWNCSVHEALDSWPMDFKVLVMARNQGGAFTAGDGSVGTPYILARGVITVGCGNGTKDPGEACDDGNNMNGDGCDRACNLEKPVCAAVKPVHTH